MSAAAVVDLAPLSIRVNAVAPRAVVTPPTKPLYDGPERKAFYLGQHPHHRIAHATEAAPVIGFLLSPRSFYITGQTVFADGDWSVPS